MSFYEQIIVIGDAPERFAEGIHFCIKPWCMTEELIFYCRVCHIKVHRHTLCTNYCPKYILQYSLFEQSHFWPIYLARSNDYWSIIIWLAREFVEFNRAYLSVNCHFWGGQREKNRQKEGHSGITYVYGKYMEYPPPPPPGGGGGENLVGVTVTQDNAVQKYTKGVYYYDNLSQNRSSRVFGSISKFLENFASVLKCVQCYA